MLSAIIPVYHHNHVHPPAQQQVIIFVLIVMCHHLSQSTAEARSRSTSILEDQMMSVDVKEKIIELQCIARCERFALTANDDVNNSNDNNNKNNNNDDDDVSACWRNCRWDVMKSPRPGFCPSVPGRDTVSKLHCLDSCNYDFDCPEVQKCCQSSCGLVANTNAAVCMNAMGLHEDPQLPPIPRILKFILARSNKVEITIQSSANSTYYCHVEARYHIGVTYSPRKFGRWHWQPVEKIAEISDKRTKWTDITFHLKPGRWYQVRVAAINQVFEDPKPPKAPQDLKVIGFAYDGQNCSVKIVWCPSKSNLPIEKYKIIWSLYIKTKDESFVSNDTSIKDKLQFEIKELKPDSSYYIQVQAITISGNRRLKSEKVSILYNTTLSMAKQNLPFAPLKCSQQPVSQLDHHFQKQQQQQQQIYYHRNDFKYNKLIGGADRMSPSTQYKVKFFSNIKHGLIVHISGLHPQQEKIYELCPQETNCEHEREYSAIRAKKDSWEFTKLKFDTAYILRPFNASDQNGTFMFTTPTCEHFYKKIPKMLIKC